MHGGIHATKESPCLGCHACIARFLRRPRCSCVLVHPHRFVQTVSHASDAATQETDPTVARRRGRLRLRRTFRPCHAKLRPFLPVRPVMSHTASHRRRTRRSATFRGTSPWVPSFSTRSAPYKAPFQTEVRKERTRPNQLRFPPLAVKFQFTFRKEGSLTDALQVSLMLSDGSWRVWWDRRCTFDDDLQKRIATCLFRPSGCT